ncbi:N(G),N(G)-dimethylarginine dimethylaminohydrolase 1-like [Gigantopelta aegis]|uniref:N(G),N(G)-dimethylarginine dimethylaminohydrolase 1-like n=1 Tax=Gigantopelta aegis TaxID=1735272 RepID=UPI001B888817|nr:N(G),N(G)-dimethylarginine dimethylaminohydrolase 1-like [Gigantopelta aegis]
MKRAASLLQYTHAVVRHIPNSFCEHALRKDTSKLIDLEKARHQLRVYIENLKACGVEVIELDPNETLPDCTFVEDTAVAVGSRVLLARPGHPSRRKEVTAIRNCLKNTLGLTDLHEMPDDDTDATLDGGDVLFTGREFFVGQSKRTNASGLKILSDTFPEFPVTGISVSDKLHIQDVATMATGDVVIGGGDATAKEIFQNIKSSAHFPYTFIDVETDGGVNVLAVNDHVFHKTKQEIGEAFYRTLLDKVKAKPVEMSFTEFAKADGSLTCCSLRLNLHYRQLT